MRIRNIAEIIKDENDGKQLSQIESRIATAYIQGKYDAVRELKIGNKSNTDEILDKIRAEIEHMIPCSKETLSMKLGVLEIIDKYREPIGAEESDKE